MEGFTNSVIKNNYLPAWRDFKINFSRPLFTIIFGYRFHFEGKTDV